MSLCKAIALGSFLVGIVALFLLLKYQKQIAIGIVQAPHSILHSVSESVNDINEEVQNIAAE